DDDSVVHVEVDGKSVGGNDSSKNLAPNLEHWTKGSGVVVKDDTVTIPVNGTFQVIVPWDGSTNQVKVGYDVIKGSNILVNFNYLGADKTTPVKDKDGLGTGNGYTSAITAGTRANAIGYYTIDSNTKYVRVTISGSSAYVKEPFTLKNISVRSDSYAYEPPAPTPDYPIEIHSLNDFDVVSQKSEGGKIDGIEVGGRNYALDTSSQYKNETVLTWQKPVTERVYFKDVGLEIGDFVTLRMYIKVPKSEKYGICARINFYREDGTYTNKSGDY